MAQIFHPAANTIAKAGIFGAVFTACFISYCTMGYDRSPWHSGVGERIDQPVPFSHQHHVRGLGIDCRYCHTSVESSHFAGYPSTKTCMSCHSQIWTNAQLLEPVRKSWRENRPIVWQRVHNLPEFVYFNHSIHIAKGMGCSTCHGAVDTMPIMYQSFSLQMQWCLQCHRNPAAYIRPRSEVYNLHYSVETDPKYPGETQESLGAKLVAEYHIHREQLTNCSICHR